MIASAVPGTDHTLVVTGDGGWVCASLVTPDGWEIDSVDKVLAIGETLDDFATWAKDVFKCNNMSKGVSE